jgi:lipopolysaccharide transport system ATP-binding protein
VPVSATVISVENLSKSYLVGHQSGRERYTALRDVIGREARNFARKAADLVRGRQIVQGDEVEEFWALKGVSFTVRQGEVLGIIGRNGAGKSTLLKILSRITEPTAGRVRIKGRVASLLEVGTGFHPELTGRENIYLNGAILGMTQREIRGKFDEIVAFADVERFLDTPVKRFSSGMYLRLAFAVAAHLQPEILVIDEVLAVGDAEFQKKCIGKMQDVAGEGRTLLFVSHNMPAIRTLCDRAILLSEGRLLSSEDIDSCIRRYEHVQGQIESNVWARDNRLKINSLGFTHIAAHVTGSQPKLSLEVTCSFGGQRVHRPALIAFDICHEFGFTLMQALPTVDPFITPGASKRPWRFAIELSGLVPGRYRLTAWLGPHNSETFDLCRDCISFVIDESPTPGRTFPHTHDHGYIVPTCTFRQI